MDDIKQCKRLWEAVIEQAIVDIKSNPKHRLDEKPYNKSRIDYQIKEKKYATYWVLSDDVESFRSFINICLILNVDYKNLREKIFENTKKLRKHEK